MKKYHTFLLLLVFLASCSSNSNLTSFGSRKYTKGYFWNISNMRRFTRLTNAFSKKIENHCHAVALHCVYYNFCKIHMTLRVTPAMEAGLTKDIMEIKDIVNLTNK